MTGLGLSLPPSPSCYHSYIQATFEGLLYANHYIKYRVWHSLVIKMHIVFGKQYGSLKKLKIELPYDVAIPLPGVYPKELKARYQRDSYIPVFTAVLFTVAEKQRQHKCPLTGEWANKMR